MPVVEKRLLSIRSSFPAHHPGGGDCDPIDTSSLICEIPANFFEALTPEHLALAGNVILSLKAIGFRTVAAFLSENCSCNPEMGVFFELIQEKFKMVFIQCNIRI